MEKTQTFFDHVRNSGLVEMKKLKRLVESLRLRKRIRYEPKPEYKSQVSSLKEVEGYNRLPPLEQYLAREFLRLDWLNVWQISQLIEGRRRFQLGEYVIQDSLGQGGYSHVFLAKSKNTAELVAIKVFQSSQSQPEAVTRFLREAMLQESISHKNIVRLITCGQDGNVDYLVFEYMAGGDVRRMIRQEVQLPILQSVRIVSQAAEGLAFLHRQGIIHRDVKPANILLTGSGDAKLGDLGLCGFLDARAEDDPRYGKLVGTADYMAPDHILNPRKSSPQWDVYSLGCTFYQMVTGIVPFPKVDSREKIMAHLRLELVDPRVFREDLPEELARILMRMMAKDPARRYQTVAEVQAELAPWCTGRTTGAEAIVAGLADEPEHVAVGEATLRKLRDYSAGAVNDQPGGVPPGPDFALRNRAVHAVAEALGSEPPEYDPIADGALSDDDSPASDSFHVESIDLDAVRDVPLDKEIYEIYELQKPAAEAPNGFRFDMPVEQIDEELPLRFDQKSLFEFVSTFEEATRIPYWKIDTLSKLRRSLPLSLRLRFAKREVTIRRFARQMKTGYVLDPRCGGERSHAKAEPTLGWYVWWLLTARPYDAYSPFSKAKSAKNTPNRDESGENAANDQTKTADVAEQNDDETGRFELPPEADSGSKTATTEYLRVRLPGRVESIVIEVPPVITEVPPGNESPGTSGRPDALYDWDGSPPVIEFSGDRAPRPFESLTILFWLIVTVFGLVAAIAVLGIYSMV